MAGRARSAGISASGDASLGRRFLKSPVGRFLSGINAVLMFALLVPPIVGVALLGPQDTIPAFIGYLGWLAVAAGAVGAQWSRVERRRTIDAALKKEKLGGKRKGEMIAGSGPYAIVRHPEYLGYTVIMLGLVLILRSGFAFVFLGVYWLWLVSMRIPAEEADLVHRYGRQYKAYRRQVRTWV